VLCWLVGHAQVIDPVPIGMLVAKLLQPGNKNLEQAINGLHVAVVERICPYPKLAKIQFAVEFEGVPEAVLEDIVEAGGVLCVLTGLCTAGRLQVEVGERRIDVGVTRQQLERNTTQCTFAGNGEFNTRYIGTPNIEGLKPRTRPVEFDHVLVFHFKGRDIQKAIKRTQSVTLFDSYFRRPTRF